MPGEPNTPGGRGPPSGQSAWVILEAVEAWSHDRWRIPLPDGHKFPIDKYERLRRRVEADGVLIHESEPVPWEWLEAVHDTALLARIRDGEMTVREQRGLGLPWSEVLVERG